MPVQNGTELGPTAGPAAGGGAESCVVVLPDTAITDTKSRETLRRDFILESISSENVRNRD